jgi:hypothetical protein
VSRSELQLLRLTLPCEPTAPRRARAAVADLPEIGPVLDDALLVVSELTTNAVLHSGCTEDDEMELWADRVTDGLRFTVCDPGHTEDEPAPRGIDPTRPGGMGLAVVEQVAQRWGTDRDGHRRVWAELAL